MVQPPASADSGNPGSSLDVSGHGERRMGASIWFGCSHQLQVRESPSLFSDPYRLDLPG